MTLQVIHTHVGFRPAHQQKKIIVTDVPEASSIFGDAVIHVFNQNELSKYALTHPHTRDDAHRGSLQRHNGDFGSYLVADVSHFSRPGVYQAYCGNECGPCFVIHDGVYRRLVPDFIRFFQVESCGRNVPNWHDACHLDDGYIPEQDRFVEAAGGWHDAGDFRKWTTSTSMNAIALLMAHRTWANRESLFDLAPGTFLREALQGVHYFLNMQDDTGCMRSNVGAGAKSRHDNLDNRYTDNTPRTGDERRLHPMPVGPTGKFTTLFALYADALRAHDPDLSARCLAAARRSAAYDLQQGKSSATELQWRAWSFLELSRLTGDAADREAAIDAMNQLLALQVVDFIGGQKTVRGFFRDNGPKPEFMRKHVGHEYVFIIIAEFLKMWPTHADAGRWRDALAMWLSDYVQIFANRNPFGLLPYGLYEQPSAEHPGWTYRPLGEQLFFRYFMAGNKMGNSARCGLQAAAIAAAAKATNQPAFLSNAYRLLEWVVGNNPFQLSLITGVGPRQPSPHSLMMGPIPGGVMQGIPGDERDIPYLASPLWSCDANMYEYYGYNTSQYFWGVMALEEAMA